jgi:deazaflavin-dependent oxidoreductase (nitroreductase family)
LQRWVEKYTVNPWMRLLLRLGLAPRAFGLVETTGRTSGLVRQTPVGLGLTGQTIWVVAEHGTGCDYVKNLQATPRVRVKVRRRWYEGTASVVADDDGAARRRAINAGNGLVGRLDGVLFRLGASTPCSVRIDLD